MSGSGPRARGRRCLRIAIAAALLLAASSWNPVAAFPARAASHVDPDVSATEPREQARPRANRGTARVTTGLDVTMDQVSPASLVPGAPVQISGTVTNVDPRRWIDLQAYLVIGDEAITTPEQLDAVLESSADAYSGERIGTSPGQRILYDELSSLAPGESTPYALEVPFGELGLSDAANGVYTVSVHVLGQRVDQARLDGADGRARILLPFLSDDQEPTGVTVAIPLHHPVRRLPDGTLEGVEALVDSISSGGLLRNRLDLVAAALTGQATLIVDPALLDVLRVLAGEDRAPGGGDAESNEPDEERTEQQAVSADFLNRLELAATRSGVLVEPYGRADLTALARGRRYHLGPMVTNEGQRALEASGITGAPAYSPEGTLQPGPLSLVARRRTVLVSADQLRAGSGRRRRGSRSSGGRRPQGAGGRGRHVAGQRRPGARADRLGAPPPPAAARRGGSAVSRRERRDVGLHARRGLGSRTWASRRRALRPAGHALGLLQRSERPRRHGFTPAVRRRPRAGARGAAAAVVGPAVRRPAAAPRQDPRNRHDAGSSGAFLSTERRARAVG
jgi:hypothetical protein